MTHILHIYKNYHPVKGGIENHIRLLCAELAKRDDFRVTVLVANTGRPTVRENRDGVEVIKAGLDLTLARTPVSWRLWYETAQLRPDITHLHFPYPFGELAYLFLGRSPKMVVTYHSDIVSQKRLLPLYRPFLRRVLRRADRIIATSPNYLRSSAYLSQVSHKCSVVPFGIDIVRFQDVDPVAVSSVRDRYGAPLLLFVGQFRYYKGLEYLIEALKQIPAKLLLVGRGPLDGSLRALVGRKGLSNKVFFLGEVSDEELPVIYHACDAFVLPSSHRSEAFGIVQLEAMACGKPVVCTEVGTGTTWVNQHGRTGLVVPPADPGALADAINTLLEDEALRALLGHAARERVEHEFTVEKMVDGVVEVYRQVMAV